MTTDPTNDPQIAPGASQTGQAGRSDQTGTSGPGTPPATLEQVLDVLAFLDQNTDLFDSVMVRAILGSRDTLHLDQETRESIAETYVQTTTAPLEVVPGDRVESRTRPSTPRGAPRDPGEVVASYQTRITLRRNPRSTDDVPTPTAGSVSDAVAEIVAEAFGPDFRATVRTERLDR